MARTKNTEQVETPVEPTVEKTEETRKRSKKDKKRSKEAPVEPVVAPVVAPVVEPVVEPVVPATEVKVKSKRSKKVETPVESKPEVPSEEETPLPEEDNDVDTTEYNEQFNENRVKTDELLKSLITVVQDRIASDKNLLSSLRDLNRQVARERKEVGKLVKKLNKGQRKKKRGGNKSPGGFTKPAPLSAQMCTFLEVTNGTELPRTEVTRRVNAYVKTHNLQNPENKKQILADKKLKELLYIKDGDELTYFNLQRFMKIHFLKRDENGVVAQFVRPL